MAATLAAVMLFSKRSSSNSGQPPPSVQNPPAAQPWGRLEYTTIELQRPDESLVGADLPVPLPRWSFPGYSESEVDALFNASDLTAEQRQALADRKCWAKDGNGWRVSPPMETVRSLSPSARKRIYGVLRKSPQNILQHNPFRISAGELDGWLEHSGLPQEKTDLIRHLTYSEGNTAFLSDFEVIESRCSLSERKLFAKAVSRNPALMVSLRVDDSTDIEALARFWGRGGRMKAMKPFLESLKRVPGGASVSVSYFFPEFARMRLYTYPDTQTDSTALKEDCFWTALNFLNERPDNRYFTEPGIRSTLEKDYVPVQTNWLFGDLLAVLEEGKGISHLCVYVADDVVFTKNGVDPLEPWVLMRIPEMMKRYTTEVPTRLVAFRKKGS